MSKNTKKKFVPTDRIKTQAISWVARQYQVTDMYIYGMLNGNNPISPRGEEMLEAYRKKYDQIKKVLA